MNTTHQKPINVLAQVSAHRLEAGTRGGTPHLRLGRGPRSAAGLWSCTPGHSCLRLRLEACRRKASSLRALLVTLLLTTGVAARAFDLFGPAMPSEEQITNNIRNHFTPAFVATFDIPKMKTSILKLDKTRIAVEFSFDAVVKETLYEGFNYGSPEWRQELQKHGASMEGLQAAADALGKLPGDLAAAVVVTPTVKKALLVPTFPKGKTVGCAGKISAELIADVWKFGGLESFGMLDGSTSWKGHPRSAFPAEVVCQGPEADAYFTERAAAINGIIAAVDKQRAAEQDRIAAQEREQKAARERYVASYRAALATGRSYKGHYVVGQVPIPISVTVSEFAADAATVHGVCQCLDPRNPVKTTFEGVVDFGRNFSEKFPLRLTIAGTGRRPECDRFTGSPLFNFFTYGASQIGLQLADEVLIGGQGSMHTSIRLEPVGK